MKRPTEASEPSDADAVAARAEGRAVEAAAIRRRWVTLGEVLAVIAVVISGLTLWNNWSDRSATKASESADARRASVRAATLVLTAANVGDRVLTLKPAAPEQSVQSQTVRFPTALALPPVETTGEPRIQAEWFENALKKARDDARMPDNSRGDERLPVAISTRFLVDGKPHDDVALYDIGYSISGRLLSGHRLTLRGISLATHPSPQDLQKRLDARWTGILAKAGPRADAPAGTGT